MQEVTQRAHTGNAEFQLGSVGGKWHSRGYLPHFNRKNRLQAISFRLADSLPQSKLKELEPLLKTLPKDLDKEQAKRRKVEVWLDQGSGCCALQNEAVAEKVQNALFHFDGNRYQLIAWCIMPNHVHVLIQPDIELSKIVQSWKSYTSRWAHAHNAELELGAPVGKPFWMRDYWDRYIRNQKHFMNVVEYIEQNPVKAGLCGRAEDWGYSSASRNLQTVKQ